MPTVVRVRMWQRSTLPTLRLRAALHASASEQASRVQGTSAAALVGSRLTAQPLVLAAVEAAAHVVKVAVAGLYVVAVAMEALYGPSGQEGRGEARD